MAAALRRRAGRAHTAAARPQPAHPRINATTAKRRILGYLRDAADPQRPCVLLPVGQLRAWVNRVIWAVNASFIPKQPYTTVGGDARHACKMQLRARSHPRGASGAPPAGMPRGWTVAPAPAPAGTPLRQSTVASALPAERQVWRITKQGAIANLRLESERDGRARAVRCRPTSGGRGAA